MAISIVASIWGAALALGAAGLALAGAALVQRHAGRLGLVAKVNERSSHIVPTPTAGGAGMVFGGTLAVAGNQPGSPGLAAMLAAGGLMLAAIGYLDDRRELGAGPRLGVQAGVVLGTLWVIGPVPELSFPGGFALAGGTFFVALALIMVWWINLFNFMDGIDGLAGSQGALMLAGAAILSGFGDGALGPLWWTMAGLAAAIAGFLVFNWPPARVFMGDTGANYLGYMIAGLALVSVATGMLGHEIWLILAAPLAADATLTLGRRMLAGERWYAGHRQHAYQHLARKLNSHLAVTMIYAFVTLVWTAPLAAAAHFAIVDPWICLGFAYGTLFVVFFALGAGRPEYV